jgi:phosphoribosylglycinamide formyltransferase-1
MVSSASHGAASKPRVAILISGRGSNMVALITAAKVEGFPAEIAVVISNRAEAAGLALASAEGIPTVTIESKPFGKDRAGFEGVLQSTLEAHGVEIICLGGFMRLFTAEFVEAWYGRMLNIHPSLLPSFPGLDPHAQALNAGVKVSGATVHFVTPETDAGPIVMQGVVAVRDDDTPDTLSARILAIEHQIYPKALRLLAGGKLRLEGAITKVDGDANGNDTLISPQPTSNA